MGHKNNLRILELCHFSAGGCGVWARARQESELLAKKGYDILVISSNLEKGSNKIVSSKENMGNVKILRYPAKKLGGESFMSWFGKEAMQKAIEFQPDIIMAHNYRHLHTTKALKLAKILREQGKSCKVFLVTHAPFVEGNITRTKIQTILVKLYDSIVGRLTLNRFDNILAISHWEIPPLIKAGAKKEKIIYIPNGIPPEFFDLKKQANEENKVLFLGRIAQKKKIETIIESIPYLKDKKLVIEIVGPEETNYLNSLKKLIDKLDVGNRIIFSPAVYDLRKKIAKIDSCKIYVLASRVEGMPQSLIEAMSRAKIAIGSDSIAIRDIIKDKQNGYLFEFDNPKSLAEKINMFQNNKKIGMEARKSVEKFNWEIIIKQIESLFHNPYKS
jgi:glycosyltransferase involved in cell wall biosynthesis